MKITDTVISMIVSAILKKGVLYEARNVDVEIPELKVNIKCEHMMLRIEKDEKTGA